MISRRNLARWPLGALFPALTTALALTGCFESETVQCEATGLICGQGSVCTAAGDACTDTPCGNGQMDTGEICDDGNIVDGDGCSPSCLSNETCNNGVLDINLPNRAPETAECRDPLATASNCAEICEDDPDDNNDRCSPNCLSTGVCGNSIVDQYLPVTPNALTAPAGPCEHSTNVGTDCKETCDDGNQESGDGCSSNCLSEEDCGNGIVDVGESCDDGQRDGRNDSTGCRNDCSGSAECGNTTVDTGEECDDQGDSVLCDGDSPDAAATGNVCTFRLCGDGYINPSAGTIAGSTVIGEACDPAMIGRDIQGCDNDCTLAACGDGYVNRFHVPTGGGTTVEACDDSNTVSGDGCSSLCRIETCGNTVIEGDNGEECDDGNLNDADACTNGCQDRQCGDGIPALAPGGTEECDTAGDSATCNDDCTLSMCGDGHINSADGEQCDDDGIVSGDGCSSLCLIEPFALSVTRAGNGAGSVASGTPGISCGLDCTEVYTPNTMVTLTATIGASSVFTGWSGACTNATGPCVVTMTGAAAVVANFQLNTLTVLKTGTGTGTVTGTGIACGVDCDESYTNNTPVTLTATPDANNTFGGWTGACTNATGTCMTTMTGARSVTATFTLNIHTLTVATNGGNGTGTVTSVPTGINCGVDCTEPYGATSIVTLTATPTANNTFTGWSGGGCTGTGACAVPMTTAQTVTAAFTLNIHQLTVVRAGTGNGSVSSDVAGITCGTDCTQGYNAGQVVVLTATPVSADSTFTGWTGAAGCNTATTCSVTVTAASTVIATFAIRQFTLTAALTGTGTGAVTSTPSGINCLGDCSQAYDHGATVQLLAVPTAGTSVFAGWSGAAGCTSSPTCVVTISAASTVTATFTFDTHVLTVVKAGNGTGTVSSDVAGIACGVDCVEPYIHNTPVLLTAAPTLGSTTTWSQGGCSGNTCLVTMDAAKTITATFTLQQFVLTAAVTGSGTINSVPFGIGCVGDCTETFNHGTVVALVASPSANFAFTGWGGACLAFGTNPLCNVTIAAATSVSATFTQVTFPLTVLKSGAGIGTVTSTMPAGAINCGATCSANVNSGAAVALTATAGANSQFVAWSGACTGATCALTMNQAHTAIANFALVTRALTVTKGGTGATLGTVTSVPTGINCGATCGASFDHGTLVALTATPGANNSFTSWTGAGAGSCTASATCVVTMDAVKTVTANFALDTFLLTILPAGLGTGTVTSDVAGINCGGDCDQLYNFGQSVVLTAAPGTGQTFTGWSGVTGCPGTGTCTVAMTAVRNVTATFGINTFALVVTVNGAGDVTSDTGGLDCPGIDCNVSYDYNTDVTLTAAPDGAGVFVNWTGSGIGACNTNPVCVVDMTVARNVTANFNP